MFPIFHFISEENLTQRLHESGEKASRKSSARRAAHKRLDREMEGGAIHHAGGWGAALDELGGVGWAGRRQPSLALFKRAPEIIFGFVISLRPYFTVRPAKRQLVSFPSRPINHRDIINILLTSFSRSVLQVTDSCFFPKLGP